MIFSSHAIIGAAVAQMFPDRPILGFCAAFASHFVCDAIPHWEYHLRAGITDKINHLNDDLKINKDFIFDFVRTGLDASLGAAVAAYLFQPLYGPLQWAWIIGVVGGLLPDFLQFVYWKTRCEPFKSLQRFHLWIHSKIKLDDYPVSGILFQIACVVAIVAMTFYVRSRIGA